MAKLKRLFDLARFSDRITNMATTSNYGWTIPDDTDLVKNGALAIRTLGNAIDTTAAASFGGGLVPINTTSFSAVSSVSLANDTFTTTYDAYRIIFTSMEASANSTLQLRLRAAGSDDTTNVYDFMYMGYATNVTTRNTANDNQTSWTTLPIRASEFGGFVFDIYNPKLAKYTGYTCNWNGGDASYWAFGSGGGVFTATTSFDSATFYPASGNITGKYSVYGYKL